MLFMVTLSFCDEKNMTLWDFIGCYGDFIGIYRDLTTKNQYIHGNYCTLWRHQTWLAGNPRTKWRFQWRKT